MSKFYLKTFLGFAVGLSFAFLDDYLVPLEGVWIAWHMMMAMVYGLLFGQWITGNMGVSKKRQWK